MAGGVTKRPMHGKCQAVTSIFSRRSATSHRMVASEPVWTDWARDRRRSASRSRPAREGDRWRRRNPPQARPAGCRRWWWRGRRPTQPLLPIFRPRSYRSFDHAPQDGGRLGDRAGPSKRFHHHEQSCDERQYAEGDAAYCPRWPDAYAVMRRNSACTGLSTSRAGRRCSSLTFSEQKKNMATDQQRETAVHWPEGECDGRRAGGCRGSSHSRLRRRTRATGQ